MKELINYMLAKIVFFTTAMLIIPLSYTMLEEQGYMLDAYAWSILIGCLSGALLMGISENRGKEISIVGGAVFLVESWLAIAFISSLPYLFSGVLNLPDAIMESISGVTTTGLTNLPPAQSASLILWRSITQWIGGLNLLLMLTNIIPSVTKGFGINFVMPTILRCGLITESRINQTAIKVMVSYLFFTLMGGIFFWLGGLSPYDAANYVMVIISTGGCFESTSEFSMNIVLFFFILFGLIASCCNILIYLQSRSIYHLKSNIINTIKSSEIKLFLLIILIIGMIVSMHLSKTGLYDIDEAMLNGFLYTVSFAGTTGLLAEKMLYWPDFEKMLFTFLAITGGCLGSMAGGFKLMRMIVLVKTSWAELKRTTHPKMVVNITVDHGAVPQKAISLILSYFFLYTVILFFSMMIISLSGYDMLQCLDIAIGSLTSTGQLAYFHMTPNDIISLPEYIKLYCCFLMVLGKAEIIAFLLIIQGGLQDIYRVNW